MPDHPVRVPKKKISNSELRNAMKRRFGKNKPLTNRKESRR